jgi:hypothetical protein
MAAATHNARPSEGWAFAWKLVRLLGLPVLVVVVFLLLVLFRGSTGALEVNASAGKITWKPADRAISSKGAQSLDASTYFIDSARGFAFKKLGAQFGAVQELTPEQFLRTKGLTLARGGFRSEPKESIQSAIFRNLQFVRFSAGHDLRFKSTPQTTVGEYGKKVTAGELPSFLFANELLVAVLPKKSIGGFHPNVVQVYGVLSELLQPLLLQLTAKDSSILAFAQGDLENVRIGSRTGSVHIDRALLVTESSTAFYGVEIQFANALDQSADLWRELRDSIESFRVIGT